MIKNSIPGHPSLDILLSALDSGISDALKAAVQDNWRTVFKRVFARARRASEKLHESVWGFHTPYGFCPVVVCTLLSGLIERPTAHHANFEFDPDQDEPWNAQLNSLLRLPLIAQLCALLQSGLLPFCMASEFGEEERKAACGERPLFWWNLEAPVLTDRPTIITEAECERFFGLAG